MAANAGADGVVASAKEARAIRARFGAALKIVTPGVRPAGADANDQKRVVTPREAIESGADDVVVGRPIVEAPDPRAAAAAILMSMNALLRARHVRFSQRSDVSGRSW